MKLLTEAYFDTIKLAQHALDSLLKKSSLAEDFHPDQLCTDPANKNCIVFNAFTILVNSDGKYQSKIFENIKFSKADIKTICEGQGMNAWLENSPLDFTFVDKAKIFVCPSALEKGVLRQRTCQTLKDCPYFPENQWNSLSSVLLHELLHARAVWKEL